MVAFNEHTGDPLISKVGLSDEGKKNWDTIFPPKKKEKYIPPPLPPELASPKATANKPVEPVQLELDFDEDRIDIIGQNGNIGYGE